MPTWNHVTAHLWGTPEILTEEENLSTLERLVAAFERYVDDPRSMTMDMDRARRAARGTVGFRLRVTRTNARAKLSQNKPTDVIASIMDNLRAEGYYRNDALADEMTRHLDNDPGAAPPSDA